jgi:hypothetical protein
LGRTPAKGEEIPAKLREALPSFLLAQRGQTPITATLILLQRDRPVTFVKGIRNGHPLGASSPNDFN